MTDKEQIIIDNSTIIDVTKCKYYNNGWCELPESRDDVRNKPCGDMTLFDCYFKELARKTQECEELKEELKREIKNTVDMERLAKSYGQDMLTYKQKNK